MLAENAGWELAQNFVRRPGLVGALEGGELSAVHARAPLLCVASIHFNIYKLVELVQVGLGGLCKSRWQS